MQDEHDAMKDVHCPKVTVSAQREINPNAPMPSALVFTAEFARDEIRKRDAEIATLKQSLAQANEIVGKLPRYKDTGKAFVPHVDPCWVNSSLLDHPVQSHPQNFVGMDTDWFVSIGNTTRDFFSTKEAAAEDARGDCARENLASVGARHWHEIDVARCVRSRNGRGDYTSRRTGQAVSHWSD